MRRKNYVVWLYKFPYNPNVEIEFNEDLPETINRLKKEIDKFYPTA